MRSIDIDPQASLQAAIMRNVTVFQSVYPYTYQKTSLDLQADVVAANILAGPLLMISVLPLPRWVIGLSGVPRHSRRRSG